MAMELDAIRLLAESGQPEEAIRALAALVEAREGEPGGHGDEGRLAEVLGQSELAVRAWRLAVRDDPEERAAWSALAALHEERGEEERARACRKRAGEDAAADSDVDEEGAATADDPSASDADLVRFCRLFAGREDVHARMWHDPVRGSGYSPVRGPLTPDLARAHLSGALTLGTYLARADGTVGMLVLDLDAVPSAMERADGDLARMRELREALHQEGLRLLRLARDAGLDPLFEDSGFKGRHLWFFLDEPTPLPEAFAAVRALARAWRPTSALVRVEAFPRQAAIAQGGLGNLVKLPLGLHLRSGRRAVLLDDEGRPLADPLARLRAVRRVALADVAHTAATSPPDAEPEGEPAQAPPVAPAPLRPEWTEADFSASSEVGPVLQGCAVLRAVVGGALADRTLAREAAVVLNHSLGHLPDGVRACNYLYDRVPGFPAEGRMGAPHRGSPISCPRIRQRLPEVAASVPCACRFPAAPGRYDHPLRHLEGPRPVPADARGPAELLATYARQLDRLRRAEEEADLLRRACAAALAGLPERRFRVEGGEWRVEEEGALRWIADAAPAAQAQGGA